MADKLHHEAGHAVAGLVLFPGGTLDFVEVRDEAGDDNTAGMCSASYDTRWPQTIVWAAAGAVFQAIYRQGSLCASDGDEWIIMEACRVQGLNADKAVADANDILLLMAENPAVHAVHTAIMAGLAEQGRLSGAQLEELRKPFAAQLRDVRNRFGPRLARLGR